jgi:small-conductance mechanosensitive channel
MIETLSAYILDYLKNNFAYELVTFALGIVLAVGFYLFRKILKKYIKGLKYYIYLKTGLSTFILVLYYFLIKWWGDFFDVKIFSSVYENLVIFYLIYEITRFIFQIADIKNKKLFKLIIGTAFINVSIIASIDIANKFNIDIGKEYNLFIIFKIISLIPISIIAYILTTNLAKRLPPSFQPIKEFLVKYYLLINFLIIFLGFLWIVNIINLSRELLIGVSIAIIITLFYIFFIYYLNERITPIIKKYDGIFSSLKSQVNTAISILYIIILYLLLDKILGLDYIVEFLDSISIVQTDVLKISVFSLIKSVIFFIFILNLIFIARASLRYWEFKKSGEFRPTPIEAIIYNFGVLFASIISLSMLGITWKVLLPLIGALGIGAGFGLQSIINNYISGFIIIFNRKVKIGDILEIPGNAGKFIGYENDVNLGIVTEIGVVNTVVETVDGIEIAIPNSEFVSGKIINYTYSHTRIRIRIPFKVGYETDHKEVERILLNVLEDFKGLILPFPKPQVWFFEMKDYYNLYYLLFWMNARHWRQIRVLRSNIYKKAWEEFKKAGIEIPVYKVEIEEKMDLKLERFNKNLNKGIENNQNKES